MLVAEDKGEQGSGVDAMSCMMQASKELLPFVAISAVLPSLMMETVMEGNLVPGSSLIDDMILAYEVLNCDRNHTKICPDSC